ncbi:hypothetical protein ACI2L1_10600 [Streptomyces sp. NPDC019531]|uniref:hypothetical protein n=1 Tax=Streptomyces sp. NPDC019531 TaxID=3365062 RepID=UPI003850A766
MAAAEGEEPRQTARAGAGPPLQREQVLDLLWPQLDPVAGNNQLRKALHEARRTLDPDPAAMYRYLNPASGWGSAGR